MPAAEQLQAFVAPGHACTFTEHDAEHFALIAQFARTGLERAEQCIYLHAEGDEARLMRALREAGIDVDAARNANALVLISPREANLKGDSFDPYRLLSFWKRLAAQARAAGFTAMRCAIAMSALALSATHADRWLEYEAQLTALAADQRCLFLCHYPRQAFAPRHLLDVVCSHASIVHDGEIAPNPYYSSSWHAPEKHGDELALASILADVTHRARLERMQRERAEERLESERRIGERKEVEETLRRRQAYLDDGERLSHTGSWAWDVASHELSFWSQGLFRIVGLDPDTMPTYARLRPLVHPDDLAFVEETFARAVREHLGFDHEFRILRADGVRYVRGVGRPVVDEHGVLVEYAGTIIDVTRQREAEATLRTTQATLARVARLTTLGELSTSIAHEVNQPLAAIILHGDAARRWLARRPPHVKETLRAIEGMMGNAHRARDVIARIRALASKADQPRELLDLNELVRDVLDIASGELRQSEILVRTELDSRLPVLGDRVQLQQVLLNLIMNAIEALHARAHGPRELVIRTSQGSQHRAHIEVRDSGIGVPEDSLGKIFEPFYTTKEQGTGIGLSISRSIVEAHNGHVWAESNEPAPGLTVHIALPYAAPAVL